MPTSLALSRQLSHLAILATLVSITAAAHAAQNRFILASQSNWEANRGFYIDLENSGGGDDHAAGEQARLNSNSLHLILAVADGTSWRYVNTIPTWTPNHQYHVQATILANHATLFLDGKELGHTDTNPLAPADTNFSAADIPTWAAAPTNYTIIETALTIRSANATLHHDWPDTNARAATAQRLFAAAPPWIDSHWKPTPNQPIKITIDFTLAQEPTDLRSLAPFVDRFGQDCYANSPEKITSDTQLQSDAAEEQRRLATTPPPTNLDAYGGDKSLTWHETATGFYHAARHNNFWWLITPYGYPCFYTGVCTAPTLTENSTSVTDRQYLFAQLPPKTDLWSAAWSIGLWGEKGNQYVSFDTANMIRKYGDTWRDAGENLCTQRLHAWAFTGLGKWAQPAGNLPFIAVLFHGSDPAHGNGKLDVFDSGATQRFRQSMQTQMQAHLKDPYLVGWSVGNEFDEIVQDKDLAAMLAIPRPTPAKQAIIAHAIELLHHGDPSEFATAWHTTGHSLEQFAAKSLTPPPADIEPLRQYYTTAYYRFIYQTIKSIDPNHLYFGFWIVPGWWQNDSDWSLIAPWCDVIGYDRYANTFADAKVESLFRQTNKPVLCGEFGFPPTYNAQRGYGFYPPVNVPDDAAAGDRYKQWVHDATRNPYCVGGTWFEYRDEPLTGRGPGKGADLIHDEHYAFGVVEVTDRPKWDLVQRMREANLTATYDRNRAAAEN